MRDRVYVSCVELCERNTWTVRTANEMALRLEACSVEVRVVRLICVVM